MSDGGVDARGVVGFAYEAGHLKRLPRAGWLLAGVHHPESVAEHTFRAAVLAYCIAALEEADPERAAVLALFHDVHETRVGDVHSVGKRYVDVAPAGEVTWDQTSGLPAELADRIGGLVAEFEHPATAEPTLEARCARDADKLECLLQAREYEAEGYRQVQAFIDTMAAAVTTPTAKALAEEAQRVEPSQWWGTVVASYGVTAGDH